MRVYGLREVWVKRGSTVTSVISNQVIIASSTRPCYRVDVTTDKSSDKVQWDLLDVQQTEWVGLWVQHGPRLRSL